MASTDSPLPPMVPIDVGIRPQLIRVQLLALTADGHDVLPEWLEHERLAADVFNDVKTNMQLVKMAAEAGVAGAGEAEDERSRIIKP